MSPFPPQSLFRQASSATAGHGEVILDVLAPNIPVVTKQFYQYPLKLISRIPACSLDSRFPSNATTPVHLYLLSYGGGLLPGDCIDVSITLRPRCRLVLTTPQGSTKIYRTENAQGDLPSKSQQTLNVELGKQTGLCYLPDPSVPYARSRYEQVQRFTIMVEDTTANAPRAPGGTDSPSLCVLDWVTQGRSARGENWSFHEWTGRNEIWAQDSKTGRKRLLLRDTVILDDEVLLREADVTDRNHFQHSSYLSAAPLPITSRAHPHGVLGTLILHGPLFESLADFFMREFASQPRIGGRNWSSSPSDEESERKPAKRDVIWTAARVRQSFVLVKFGAREFETAKDWLGEMMRREGSIVKEFGDEALGSL
jgi:urease accessory protein